VPNNLRALANQGHKVAKVVLPTQEQEETASEKTAKNSIFGAKLKQSLTRKGTCAAQEGDAEKNQGHLLLYNIYAASHSINNSSEMNLLN
jgi:hypothetical protein